MFSSWLLLGRPAVNASESNCAHFLEGRLDLFWEGDWPWCVQSVTLPLSPVQSAEPQQIKNTHASAKWQHWLDQVSGAALWLQPEMHHQSQSRNRLFK